MSRSDTRPLSALTIAGSDSGGGAGIQADLKTFAAHGVHGLSAIAALTAQHTRGVTAVHVPSVAFLRAQIDACFDDFRIGAVKLGMLANTEVIYAVADALEHHKPPHIVLDPVMVATSGARLLEADALDALRARLLPLATILTPNIPEAELLLGHPIDDDEAADAALVELPCIHASLLYRYRRHFGSASVSRMAAKAPWIWPPGFPGAEDSWLRCRIPICSPRSPSTRRPARLPGRTALTLILMCSSKQRTAWPAGWAPKRSRRRGLEGD